METYRYWQKEATRLQLEACHGRTLLSPFPDERYFHADLANLTTDNLRTERARLRFERLATDRPDSWNLERLERIDDELRGRHE